jgi:carbon-monoxide dehydrogenase small subunit
MDQKISFVVYGKPATVSADPAMPLLYALHSELGLNNPKFGCGKAQCGACTVHVDGRAVKSCTMLAVQADGSAIRTIEGMQSGEELHPLQQAFWAKHGLQCGFCTPGMIMAAADLLERTSEPSDEEIRHAIEGNYCRCTGYHNIVAAIREAASTMQAAASAPAGASTAAAADV